MQLKRLLLTTTSLCMLTFAPLPVLAQDAGLVAAYNAYVEASSGDDAEAKAAAEAAFLAACGLPSLDECIALATGAVSAEPAAPAEDPAPAEEPAPAAEEPEPVVEEPAPAEQPVEEPAPAPAEPAPAPAEPEPAPAEAEPAPAEPAQPAAEQPAADPVAEEPAPAEPASEEPANPSSDPALISAYEAYVSASSGGDAGATATAEAAFLAECNRLGIASLDECLALMGGAPAAPAQSGDVPAPAGEAPVDPSGQPLEAIPNQETPDAPVAPVLDSAKDDAETGETSDAPPAEAVAPPASDAEVQTTAAPTEEEVTAEIETEGERVEAPPAIEPPAEARRVRERDRDGNNENDDGDNNGFIINIGVNINIFTPYKDRDRLWRDDDEVYYERLERDRYRQTVIRPDGTRVITVWDRNGEIIRRVKVRPDGTRIILVYYAGDDRDNDWRDPGDDLPPFYLNVPVREYVLYSESADEGSIEDFFIQPPLEVAARVYTVDEVKRSARLRDTVRRVEIGDLTFDTGSAQIDRDQVGSLGKVAAAIQQILERSPGEVFLIEGHTDAVGSDESNLVLSDDRAETVARIMTEFYDIPPENLTTQGYGESYLKVETESAERANRRATVRRITSLVAPSAS